MVERYNQPSLPSPVVGTPGVNKAAGAAAGEAARLGEQAVNEQFAAARSIGRSAGAGDQALLDVVRGAGQAREHAQYLADELQSAKNKVDIFDTTSKAMTQAAVAHAQDPQNAPDAFKQSMSGFLDSMAENPMYTNRPGLLQRDTAYAASAYEAGFNHLNTQILPKLTANLNADMNLAPQAAITALGKQPLNLDVPTMIQQTIQQGKNATVMMDLAKDQAVKYGLDAKAEQFETNSLKNIQNIHAAGAANLVASVTPDAGGLARVPQIRAAFEGITEQAQGAPLPGEQGKLLKGGLTATNIPTLNMSPEQREKALAALDKKERDAIAQGVNIIKTQSAIDQANDNNNILRPMLAAEQDGKGLNGSLVATYQGKINTRLNDLAGRLGQVENWPESNPLKKQTVLEIKTQQGKLLGGTKGLVQQAGEFESKSFRDVNNAYRKSMDAVNLQLSKLGLQIQINNEQYRDNRDAAKVQATVQEVEFARERTRIMGMEDGQKKYEAADQLDKEVDKYNNWGILNGVVSAQNATDLRKTYGTDVLKATTWRPGGWTEPPAVHDLPEDAQGRADAEQAAAARDTKLNAAGTQENQQFIQLLDKPTPGLPDLSRAALMRHMVRSMPTEVNKMLNDKTHPLAPGAVGVFMQRRYNSYLQQAVKGILPEQLLERKLELKEQQIHNLGGGKAKSSPVSSKDFKIPGAPPTTGSLFPELTPGG
jgi:hypothetical protein